MQVGASRMLFDSGPGTMRRLLEAQTTIFDITHIFYSHFHPDHSGEFGPFIFATKYPDSSRRKIPLTVAGGRGLLTTKKALPSALSAPKGFPPFTPGIQTTVKRLSILQKMRIC
jgi:ribonuclease BN (tRNA processing enzyme)